MSDTNDSGETQFGRGEGSGQPRIIPKSAKEALRPEQVPEPPSRRRSRKARSQIVIFLNFVMTVVVFATIIGIVVSFVVAYASIAWLLKFVATNDFTAFVIYRIVLALLIAGLLLSGHIAAV